MLIVITVGLAQDKSETVEVDPKLEEAKKELRDAKKELITVTKQLTMLQESVGEFSGLLSPVKKDRIHSAYKLWGSKLPQTAIAQICEASEAQVSTEVKVLNSNGKGVV